MSFILKKLIPVYLPWSYFFVLRDKFMSNDLLDDTFLI